MPYCHLVVESGIINSLSLHCNRKRKLTKQGINIALLFQSNGVPYLLICFYDVYLRSHISMCKSLWIQVPANFMNACKISLCTTWNSTIPNITSRRQHKAINEEDWLVNIQTIQLKNTYFTCVEEPLLTG